MQRRAEAFARDIDLVTRHPPGVIAERTIRANVTHGHCAAVLAAESGRGQLTGALAIHEDGLTAPWKCGRIVETKHQQFLAHTFGLLPKERTAADEFCALVQRDCVAESGLPRCLVGSELSSPCSPAGFDAKRIDGVIPRVAQAEVGACGV